MPESLSYKDLVGLLKWIKLIRGGILPEHIVETYVSREGMKLVFKADKESRVAKSR